MWAILNTFLYNVNRPSSDMRGSLVRHKSDPIESQNRAAVESRSRVAVVTNHSMKVIMPRPRVGALSDDARLTSVCRVHRAQVENREAQED